MEKNDMKRAEKLMDKNKKLYKKLANANTRQNEPNEQTRMAMRQAEEGKDLIGPFESIQELMDALENRE